MNNKQAKAIRKVARSITNSNELNFIQSGVTTYELKELNTDGSVKKVQIPSIVRKYAEGSYTQVYRQLKKDFLKTPRNER